LQFLIAEAQQIPLRARRFAPILLRRACDKSTRRAKFRLTRRANHHYESRHPVPEEGALAIVTERWDGIAVDVTASCAEKDCRAG
jgi:hypothetical protein